MTPTPLLPSGFPSESVQSLDHTLAPLARLKATWVVRSFLARDDDGTSGPLRPTVVGRSPPFRRRPAFSPGGERVAASWTSPPATSALKTPCAPASGLHCLSDDWRHELDTRGLAVPRTHACGLGSRGNKRRPLHYCRDVPHSRAGARDRSERPGPRPEQVRPIGTRTGRERRTDTERRATLPREGSVVREDSLLDRLPSLTNAKTSPFGLAVPPLHREIGVPVDEFPVASRL